MDNSLWNFSKYQKSKHVLIHLIAAKKEGLWSIHSFGSQIYLDRYGRGLALEFSDWKGDYGMIDFSGKTILDVGCHNFESGAFFVSKGASTVIGIDIDPEACAVAEMNRNAISPASKVICKKFELSDLDRSFDFLKVDVEGAERILLELDTIPAPSAIEVHGMELIRRFKDKFSPDKIIYKRNGNSIMQFFK